MPRYYFDFDTEPRWEPLRQLARLCRTHPELPELRPDEFMYMGRLVRGPGQPPILQYKHRWTRGYLSLDDAGHAYTVAVSDVGPGGAWVGASCRPSSDLRSALVHVLALDRHLVDL